MKLNTYLFTMLVLLGCSTNGQQSRPAEGWEVIISGKVGFPQQGTISIMELTRNGNGWQDTIKLKSNYTFSKKVRLTEPGYYKINFYNRQVLDVILSGTTWISTQMGTALPAFLKSKARLTLS